MWIYIQDLETGLLWSATRQPAGISTDNQEILYFPHKVEFRSRDQGISLHAEITVAEDGVEIRRVTLLNDSNKPRRLKLTSYSEVVLALQAIDQAHPAFNKLFIESEYSPAGNALVFHRRPRSAEELPVYLAHALVVEPGCKVTGEYESDRTRFIGRGRTLRSPAALEGKGSHLSGTLGGTLDPIFSLAQEIDLKPHSSAQVSFLTLAARSSSEVLGRVNHYQSFQAINLAFDEALAHSEKELAEIGVTPASLEYIQQLLSVLLYPNEALRAAPAVLAKKQ